MPTSIRTPMSDITLSVVWVSGSTTSTPMKPIGIASMIRNGSLNDRNCATRIRNSRTTESDRPMAKLLNEALHALHHAAQVDADVATEFHPLISPLISAATLPRSSPDGRHVDVGDALDLVVIDLGGRLNEADIHDIAENRCAPRGASGWAAFTWPAGSSAPPQFHDGLGGSAI